MTRSGVEADQPDFKEGLLSRLLFCLVLKDVSQAWQTHEREG